MTIFTRGFLLLSLLICFYSCARRQQALYQFTPPQHFTRTAPSATIDKVVTTSVPDEIEPAGELLAASSTMDFRQYVDQIERKKDIKDQVTNVQSRTKTPAVTSGIYGKKEQSHKLLLLKKRLRDAGPQTSGLAIASLVSGILALFILGVVFGPLAIIFGGVALSKIRKNPEVKGRGLAVAGLVLGIVATILIIVILIARAAR
jgi:hypothetical protein